MKSITWSVGFIFCSSVTKYFPTVLYISCLSKGGWEIAEIARRQLMIRMNWDNANNR